MTQDKFQIIDHNKFIQSTYGLFYPPYARLSSQGYISCVSNPTEAQKRQYGYMPFLTVTKRGIPHGFSITLKIQFSAPKLLYGNNFDEVKESDFQLILNILYEKIQYLGVYVEKDNLANSLVSSIHYGKNIIIKNGFQVPLVLSELSKCDFSKIYDFNKADYRTGHSVRVHTNSFEMIFYDKVEDLKQSKKSERRAIEDDNKGQLSFLEILQANRIGVLRMEARLNTSKVISNSLKQIGYLNPNTFENLFKEEISQKLLLYKWENIEQSYPQQSILNLSLEDITADIIINNPILNLHEVIEAVGFTALINEIGTRDLRALLQKYGDRNWQRLKKKMNSHTYKAIKPDYFGEIKMQLQEFNQVKLADYINRV